MAGGPRKSLRAWLPLKRTGAPFAETLIGLRRPETQAEIARHSPSGKVPALIDGEVVIWDSLAICEYLADRFPDAGLWPNDAPARALWAARRRREMHSGFASLRGECPMDLSLRTQIELSEATADDVRRIVRLWSDLRDRFGADGPVPAGRLVDRRRLLRARGDALPQLRRQAQRLRRHRRRPAPTPRPCWRRRISSNGKRPSSTRGSHISIKYTVMARLVAATHERRSRRQAQDKDLPNRDCPARSD